MDAKLLTSPVRPALISMAAPAAFGMLMTFTFQLIDTYFVGMLGTDQLAAMSFSYPVYILVVSLFMGSAVGVSSTVAKALGEGDVEKARRLTSVSLLVFMLLTVILTLVGLLTSDYLFKALGAREALLPTVKQYMIPLFIGMAALVGGLIGNAALMAKGVLIRSTIVMAIGGVVNVIFDYWLIFGIGPFPAMGLEGAAIATVISWLTILIAMTALLVKESLITSNVIITLKQTIEELTSIFHVALPAIAAQLLNPIAIAVITRSVAQYGDDAIAAFGIATRIESLVLVGILSLSVVMTPFIAQNYGAKRWLRLDSAVAHSGRLTVYWGMLAFIVVAFFSESIIGLFTSSQAIVELGSTYLWVVGASFPLFGLSLVTTSFLNGVQVPRLSLKLTLVKSLLLTIPLAVIGSTWALNGIWLGVSLANLLGAIYAYQVLNQWIQSNRAGRSKQSIMDDYKADLEAIKKYVERCFSH
ncbi:MATE family efflux transporter [Vibrio methylphosphonaticus]|uniref:MATE family efflux transporter n=1 Tax=Vibrio methylphosphonaticus TaxID=2946866 RepID=UPI00202A519B|nr:MATE family efflux transporter [Vibrio methylphosphonaticus]MCL9776823.1 MATE family efflux transporter [Vibrio methylphosphonaticus]